MIQSLLEIFTTQQKAEAMLASPMIEFIFMTLFVLFIVTVIIHFALFFSIRNIRNYVTHTNQLDIEPLKTFKTDFEKRQADESIKVETFVQEKISSWRMFHIPVVNLIKLVQMTVSVFILLGVLGTFIGLTISLGSIETTVDQLVENVSGVLSGIDVAFYTSIVGMGFSLIMTILVRVFNTEYLLTDFMLKLESLLEGEEQHGMNRMIQVSEMIHQEIEHLQATNEQSLQGIVQAFDGFKDYTAGLEQAATDLATFNDGLSQNLTEFQTLFLDMKDVTDGFSTGTSALNNNFDRMFTYFEQNDKRQERVMSRFEQTYDQIEQVQTAQLHSFTTFDGTVEQLKDFTTNSLQEQKEIQPALQAITDEIHRLATSMEEHQTTLTDIFGDDLHTSLASMTSYISELAKGFDQVGQSIVTLPKALDVINDTQAKHKDLLTDRFQELKDFNERFHHHIEQHANQSTTFEQQIREASQSYEQMTEKNRELMQEINRMIENIKQTFSQRDHELESNVTMVKDTLANYVRSLEGTLGQKLDTVHRSIEQSMQQTNDRMYREMTEMSRMSGEANQHQIRSNEQLLRQLTNEIQTMNHLLSNLSQQQTNPRQIGRGPHEF